MKILIIDNQDLILHCLTLFLEESQLCNQVITAKGFEEGLSKAKTEKPDFIISCYVIENETILPFLNQLNTQNIHSKCILLSLRNEGSLIETLLSMGVYGIINKISPKQEILNGIISVIKGNQFLCSISKKSLKQYQQNKSYNRLLSQREFEILNYIIQEKKNSEIANLLYISVSTVETHKKNIIRKTGVKSTIGLVKYVSESKML
jgi:DNA-binding NarL/FixJ family response regulator